MFRRDRVLFTLAITMVYASHMAKPLASSGASLQVMLVFMLVAACDPLMFLYFIFRAYDDHVEISNFRRQLRLREGIHETRVHRRG